MTKLLQRLRDELVRRDYAATTIRSYVQIVDAFRQHAGARLDRITPTQLRRYHLFSSRSAVWRSEQSSRRSARCAFSVGTSCTAVTYARTCRIRRSDSGYQWCSVPRRCSA